MEYYFLLIYIIKIISCIYAAEIKCNSPQFSSSLRSSQSGEWSHLHELGTQCPLAHLNSDLAHVCGLDSDVHASNCSSAPSKQSSFPSQMLWAETQCAPATQWKEPLVQFKQEISSLPSPQWSTPSQRWFTGTHLPLLHTNFGKPAKIKTVL